MTATKSLFQDAMDDGNAAAAAVATAGVAGAEMLGRYLLRSGYEIQEVVGVLREYFCAPFAV